MPYDDRWLADVLAKGQVRLVGSGGAGARGHAGAYTPDLARPHLSEKAFMAAVVRLAREHGWYAFHPTIAKKSVPGYPDLTLCHPTRHVALWSELKVEGGQMTLQQVHWLKALSEVRETAAFVWTPADMETIRMRLT